MTPVRIMGIALLIAGMLALYFGWQASQSLVDQAHETLTSRFTDETTWYFISGGAAVVVGLLLTLFGLRRQGVPRRTDGPPPVLRCCRRVGRPQWPPSFPLLQRACQ